MRCCLFTFFFLCVVVFVQIRLRQQRDLLKFPLKFGVSYKVKGDPLLESESTKVNITEERILYGSPTIHIRNKSIISRKGIIVSCFLNIDGPPLTFHTVSIKSKFETLISSSVLLNTLGVGHVYFKHEFYHLNPSFFISHRYDDHIHNQQTFKNASITGFVEIRNLMVVLDKAVTSVWIPL